VKGSLALRIGCRQRGANRTLREVLLDNGVIRTLDESLPAATGLLVEGERVAAVGGDLAHRDRVDLRGRCVIPGLADAHVHFPTWAMAQREVRLDGTRSLDETVERVATATRSAPPRDWLRGRGWRTGDWVEPVEPTRQALDRIAGDLPVALWSRDYHSLWLSSAALARAGGDLDVPGGVVERDDAGEPTGVLREAAAWRFRDLWSRPTTAELVDATRVGMALASERGVTAIHDKDGWLGALEVWQRVRAEHGLSLRVWQSLPHDWLERLAGLGLRSGLGDDWLRVGYLKAFMDGTLGSSTALRLDGSGVRITATAELERIVRRAAAAGFPVAVHAIGDLANREALDGFEAARDSWAPLGLRQRIEHAQLLAPAELPRFARVGVAASVQFSHAPADRDIAEREWGAAAAGSYAYRSLAEAGALLANGSDAPVEELDPIAGLRAGVLRTLDDRGPWRPDQSLTPEQALRASTVAPAWLSGDEQRRGRLRPGMLADLVVLNRDPLSCEPEELTELKAVATMVGGRWTHNAPPW
jgi:predicted amidohydrolase YtcJ